MIKTQRGKIWGWVVVLILVAVVIAGVLNREWIYDWLRGATYQPTVEMVGIELPYRQKPAGTAGGKGAKILDPFHSPTL